MYGLLRSGLGQGGRSICSVHETAGQPEPLRARPGRPLDLFGSRARRPAGAPTGSTRAIARSVRFTSPPASLTPYGLDQGDRSVCSVHERGRPLRILDSQRPPCLLLPVAYPTRAAAGWTIEYSPPENRVSAKPEALAHSRPSFVPFKRKPAHTRPRSRNLASIASPSTTSHW